MPSTDINVRRETSRRHYRNNREKVKDAVNARRYVGKKLFYRWVIAFKKQHPCEKCGFSDYRALQFHHRDPSQKRFNISQVPGGYGLKAMELEIVKCDILCANCHMIEHYPDRRKKR